MRTTQEFCPRHGHGEFFLAIEETCGESWHCPECHPELYTEYQEADEEREARKAKACDRHLLIRCPDPKCAGESNTLLDAVVALLDANTDADGPLWNALRAARDGAL